MQFLIGLVLKFGMFTSELNFWQWAIKGLYLPSKCASLKKAYSMISQVIFDYFPS